MGNASLEDYQRALRTLTYRNLHVEPDTGLRRIHIFVMDDLHVSNTVTISINIALINDNPPQLMTNGLTLSHVETSTSSLNVGTAADITLTDADVGGEVASLTVELIGAATVETIVGVGFSGTSHLIVYQGSRDVPTAQVNC